MSIIKKVKKSKKIIGGTVTTIVALVVVEIIGDLGLVYYFANIINKGWEFLWSYDIPIIYLFFLLFLFLILHLIVKKVWSCFFNKKYNIPDYKEDVFPKITGDVLWEWDYNVVGGELDIEGLIPFCPDDLTPLKREDNSLICDSCEFEQQVDEDHIEEVHNIIRRQIIGKIKRVRKDSE